MRTCKPVHLGVALGFAATLACAPALAGQKEGSYGEREGTRYEEKQGAKPQEGQPKPGMTPQEDMEKTPLGQRPQQPAGETRTDEKRTEDMQGMKGEARRGRDFGDVGRIDRNRDRFISEDEHKEWRESVFGELDSDKDGELTELEYIVLVPVITPRIRTQPEELAARFEKLDKEQKGKVTKDEYIDAAEEEFEQADTDRDGKLSVQELQNVIRDRG